MNYYAVNLCLLDSVCLCVCVGVCLCVYVMHVGLCVGGDAIMFVCWMCVV